MHVITNRTVADLVLKSTFSTLQSAARTDRLLQIKFNSGCTPHNVGEWAYKIERAFVLFSHNLAPIFAPALYYSPTHNTRPTRIHSRSLLVFTTPQRYCWLSPHLAACSLTLEIIVANSLHVFASDANLLVITTP